GHGWLERTAVMIRADDEILEFGLTLTPSKQIHVALASDEPVGNLFSDGVKLWIIGAGRIYTLTGVLDRLNTLEARIAAGDINARFDRAHLYRIQNQFQKLADELKAAYTALAESKSP